MSGHPRRATSASDLRGQGSRHHVRFLDHQDRGDDAWTSVSHVILFWIAFILTRPLGATVGDFFDKPLAQGGLNFSRSLASAVLAAFIVACILILPQWPGTHPGTSAEPV
jgi:hypothetical protein